MEIGTETPIFLFWEYLLQIFDIFSLQCRRPCNCRCHAVEADPADVNFLATIGIHTCMLPTFSGTFVVACVPAIAGILEAAGVSVVAGVLAVFGVVPAVSSCMTAVGAQEYA